MPRPPASSPKRLAVAAGAGVAVGLVGTLLAAVVGVVLAARRVAGRVSGLARRGKRRG